MSVVRRPKLLDNLADAYDWIAPDDEKAAARLLDLVDATASRLARFPYIGAPRDELAPALRSIRIRPFRHLLFYRVTDDEVVLIRLLHGSQDLPRQSFPG